ncbi:hypothetical protein GCM10028824_11100 [Hymenobacter segetis]|uniref:DUF4890 domain-containing protein n=1 Tax=Hymenobacter segetis TaxID=2025509 RepID=A0ABU9LYD2_9BACT
MKKNLLLLAALAFATAGTSFAQTAVKTTGTDANQTARHYAKGKQGPKDPAKMADHKAGKMAKELGLNADQEAKVEQLMLARQQEMTALKTKYGTDRNAGRTEMKAAHDRYEAQLKTILTPEQYAKMDKMKAEHHGGHGKGHDGGKMKMKAKA